MRPRSDLLRRKGSMHSQRPLLTSLVVAGLLAGCQQEKTAEQTTAAPTGDAYAFTEGFPPGDTAQKAYDNAGLNRAIEAYRFFYPNVSIMGLFKGFEKIGAKDNQSFFMLEGRPSGVLFTPE